MNSRSDLKKEAKYFGERWQAWETAKEAKWWVLNHKILKTTFGLWVAQITGWRNASQPKHVSALAEHQDSEPSNFWFESHKPTPLPAWPSNMPALVNSILWFSTHQSTSMTAHFLPFYWIGGIIFFLVLLKLQQWQWVQLCWVFYPLILHLVNSA